MAARTEAAKERARARARAWHWANRARANTVSAKWAENNREKARERTRLWRAANQERASENDRNKRANRSTEYLQKRCIDEQNRRARIKANGGTLSRGLTADLMHAQNGRCTYCSADLALGYHRDHIVSLAAGGKNEDENIQLLCPTCNRRKHVKTHAEFWRILRCT